MRKNENHVVLILPLDFFFRSFAIKKSFSEHENNRDILKRSTFQWL